MSVKIYVKKNIKSIDAISEKVALHLKRGNSVQIQYTEQEREIIMRFHKRIIDSKLYDELFEFEFPSSGCIKYTNSKLEISTEVFMEPTGYRHVILEYDSFASKWKRIKELFEIIKNDIKGIIPKKEKW